MGISFLILGALMLILGIWARRRAKKHHDHEGEEGSVGLILAGFFLIVLYGLVYTWLLHRV